MPQAKSQDLGFPLYMTMCATIAAISGFNVGWHISVPNMPQSVISNCTEGTINEWPLPACLPMSNYVWQVAPCIERVGAFPLGGLVGSLASMYLNTWFGRRDNIILACVWMIIGGILSACSINVAMYSLGRAFVGIASGMSGSSVAIYISEISTKKSRGALGSLFELFLNFGLLLTQLSGLYMSKVPIWRLLWAIPTIISGIQIILLVFFTVECPRRLCANKQYDKARMALQKLRAGANIEEEFAALLAARQRDAKAGPRMSVLDIILLKDRRVTWNTVIVMVIQAYNQIGGIGPMSVYSVGFLTKVFGGNEGMATNISLADATGNIIATAIALMYMHKVGRKGFMLISLGGMTIGSIFLVVGSTAGNPQKLGPLVITAALLFTFTYSMGCGVIPWMIAPELLPMHALAAGSALGNSSNWLFNFIVNTVWPLMDSNLGNYSFTVFIAINAIGFLFVLFFMRETTGKDLDQQQTSENPSIESGVTATSQASLDGLKQGGCVDHLENAR
ncbi:hypothetical protein EC973_000994 [Apophysomyces ossiformis]|uniref:Major facilitator superfamily (MFS) profile domain-containing protein n=1 Tax=Apophysomyces ossiformis TaxID=679940 RepID=A0A8H7BY88_9FUNG|nr:hypothetical protein EC973_000994 [Apophysomyces ossiformis]